MPAAQSFLVQVANNNLSDCYLCCKWHAKRRKRRNLPFEVATGRSDKMRGYSIQSAALEFSPFSFRLQFRSGAGSFILCHSKSPISLHFLSLLKSWINIPMLQRDTKKTHVPDSLTGSTLHCVSWCYVCYPERRFSDITFSTSMSLSLSLTVGKHTKWCTSEWLHLWPCEQMDCPTACAVPLVVWSILILIANANSFFPNFFCINVSAFFIF